MRLKQAAEYWEMSSFLTVLLISMIEPVLSLSAVKQVYRLLWKQRLFAPPVQNKVFLCLAPQAISPLMNLALLLNSQ